MSSGCLLRIIRIFEKATAENSVDLSEIGRNCGKHKGGILKSLDEIHDHAVNHFVNPE